MASPAGVEPTTACLEGRCSIRLSYEDETAPSLLGTSLRDCSIFPASPLEELRQRGAEGVVLGCTEFPLVIKQSDVAIPVFDTAQLHSRMAVDFILGRAKP